MNCPLADIKRRELSIAIGERVVESCVGRKKSSELLFNDGSKNRAASCSREQQPNT
jgi:hypothetical protein